MNPLFRYLAQFSKRLTPRHLSQCDSAKHFYFKSIEAFLSRPGSVVADVAGGKDWFFDSNLKKTLGLRVVGIDIDAGEMKDNPDLDERITADCCRAIPTPHGPYAVITCRAGVEHFHDTAGFLRATHAALDEDGVLVLWFPNKYAPFALLNQILPLSLSSALLKTLTVGGQDGRLGFRAYYDKTSYAAFTRAYKDAGFELDYFYPSYFSSNYFLIIPPVYFVSLAFDYLRFCSGIKSAASYYCFVLRKPSGANTVQAHPHTGFLDAA